MLKNTGTLLCSIFILLFFNTNGFGWNHEIFSPDGNIRFNLKLVEKALKFEVFYGNLTVVRSSDLMISVNKRIITRNAVIHSVEPYRFFETYPCIGVHNSAINNGFGAKVYFRSGDTKTNYLLDIRVFNDGIAYSYKIPSAKKPQIPDEAGTFNIPVGTTVWYHGLGNHYEDEYKEQKITNILKGTWAAPPVTMKLPGDGPFLSLTEAALTDYPGMALQANAKSGFTVKLAHTHPASYPFILRYGEQEAQRLIQPASFTDTIITPWRVLIIAPDLHRLVNTDILHNLCPSPNPVLFTDGLNTPWIKTGRAVWRYLDGGGKTDLETQKEFCRLAGELGFEYCVVEGFWRNWSDEEVKKLVDFARQQNVGIFGWQHSKEIRDSLNREAFFDRCSKLGLAGVKIDFLDHEAKETIDLYRSFLESAARHKLMVNFHGANKPTGLNRTYPNEITREAVRGMESGKLENRALQNVILPFTRMVAGNADYTPVHFGERRKNTTWAHQLATAVIFNSNLLTYAANPWNIKDNPCRTIIEKIPACWDETQVLPPSEIGKIALFVRRKGNDWFIACLNGNQNFKFELPLSFLMSGTYNGTLILDGDNSSSVKVSEVNYNATIKLQFNLVPGGGFVCYLKGT